MPGGDEIENNNKDRKKDTHENILKKGCPLLFFVPYEREREREMERHNTSLKYNLKTFSVVVLPRLKYIFSSSVLLLFEPLTLLFLSTSRIFFLCCGGLFFGWAFVFLWHQKIH